MVRGKALSNREDTELVRDASAIAEIAARIAQSGRFAMDLEFMSADRYIPDLALVQLCWEEGGKQCMALIDGVDTELGPVFEQVASDAVLLVAHGAKQDLSLLGTRYQVKAGSFIDTQIAAAFAGIAEQIGYANLVNQVLGKTLDKGPQFTNWMRRPLSDKQLKYALDDVRYLLPIWDHLRASLDKSQRRAWAQEESVALSEGAATRLPADEAFRNIGGANSLRGSALAALKELAAWREELALRDNLPPSWIIPDVAAIEACRKNTKSQDELKKLKGIGGNMVRQYGQAIVDAIASGRLRATEVQAIPPSLDSARQAQASVITALVAGRATEIGIPPKSIAAKADAEALVLHSLGKGKGAEECKLLRGWRYEVIGERALRWLRGEALLAADDKLGVRVVDS